MPIPGSDDSVILEQTPVKDNYITTAVVDVDTPIIKIKQYIEGSNWTVDYFNQLKGEDDNVDQLDPNTPTSLQQYVEIKDFILKVISPLETTSPDTLEGSGTITYDVKPNVNDIFKVTISEGRKALFRITEVDLKHYNLSNVFDVSYKLLALEDVNPLYFTALTDRVVRTLYFNKDSILDESSPILISEDRNYQQELKRIIPEISDYYIYKFRNVKESFLTLEVNDVKMVDPLINALFFHIVDGKTRDLTLVNRVGSFDIKRDIMNTLIETLLLRRKDLLKTVNKDISIVQRSFLINNPVFKTLYYSTIDYVALNPKDDLNVSSRKLFIDTFSRVKEVEDSRIPFFGEDDTSYLFTEDFFNENLANLSDLEILVLDFLDEKTLDREKMHGLMDNYREWTDVEQYYYLPVLLMLTVVEKREIFSKI